MEKYGETGYIFTLNKKDMKIMGNEMNTETSKKITSEDVAVYEEPFAYFADVIKKKIIQMEYGLYSLKNNLEVVKISDAARESAIIGKIILVKDYLKFQRLS